MSKARVFFIIAASSIAASLFATTAVAAPLDPIERDTIPVGSAPGAIGHYAPLARIFVGNTGDGTVSTINEITGQVIRSTPVGPAPHGIAVDQAAGRVFVAMGETNRIAVLNVRGEFLGQFGVPECNGPTGPWGITVNPSTSIVYVACYSAARVVALHGATGTILRVHEAGFNAGPLGIVVDPATNLVYVGLFGLAEIRVLDGATLSVFSRITRDVHEGTWGLALDPDTHRVFAANFYQGTVSTIVGSRVTRIVGGFSGPEWIAYDSVRHRVWVPEFNSPRRVTAIDSLGRVIPVAISGSRPTAVTASPTGFVYSANFGTADVSVIF